MHRTVIASWHATAKAILLVVSLVLTLVVVSTESRAMADTPTTYAAARLINDSAIDAPATLEGALYPGGLYSATSAQATSLRVLESQAVRDVIHDHHLAPTDINAVLSWGRQDAEADLWARVRDAIKAVQAATADNDQKNVNAWLGAVLQRQGQLTAQDAGLEFTKWAGLGTAAFGQLIANNAPQDQLTNFLRTTPNPYTGTGGPGNPGGSTDGGYCTYIAPAPLQDQYTTNVFGSGAAQQCSTPCSDPILGCPIPTPTFAQFAAFGAADFQNTLLSTTGTARAVNSTAVGSALAAVASGGAAAAGLGTTFALSSVMADTAFQQSVFPYATALDKDVLAEAEAVWDEDGFDGVEALDEAITAADEIGSEVAATGVGAIVAAIIFAVTTAIEVGMHVILTDQVPNQVAQLIAQSRTATPDVFAALSQQPSGTFALFAGATLPLPSPKQCDNSTLPFLATRPTTQCLNPTTVPGQQSWDPQWVVTPRSGGGATTQSTLVLSDATSGLTTSSFLHGNWIVTGATVNGITGSVQGLRLHYVDWDGKGHEAWVFANQSPAEFLTVRDADLGSTFNTTTCQTAGTCGLTSEIQVTGASGAQETVALTPGGEAPPLPTPPQCPSNQVCPPPDASTTSITGPTTVHVGQSATYTVVVNGSTSEGGSVDVVDNGDAVCTNVALGPESGGEGQIITGMQATCDVTFTTPGPHFVFATYNGSFTFNPSQGEVSVSAVVPVSTTTILGAAHGGVVVGQPDTFTARVFPNGTAPAAGSVTFTRQDDGTTLCDKVDVTQSNLPGNPFVATCTKAFGSIAEFDVHAAYSGATQSDASSGDVIESVLPAATSVTITPSPAAPVVGQQVTYTATVSVNDPGSGTPTGTVDFDGAASCTGVALTATAPFTATCTATFTTSGNQRVDAHYNGDANTTPSGNTATVMIGRVATTVTIDASPAAPVVGQPVTFTATVADTGPGVAVPSGLLQFQGGAQCDNLNLTTTAPYTASCTVTFTAAGDVSVSADYSGDDVTAPAVSTTHVTVSKVPTTTTLTASPAAPVVGQQVTYTATVALSGTAVPSGTVAFSGLPTCATVALSATTPYVATCTTSYSTSGDVSVTATYAGDGTTATSADTKVITVGKESSVLSLVASPGTSTFGQTVGLTATVSPSAIGPTPTGSVTFTVDGRPYGTAVALSGGHASPSPLQNLAPGTHTLAATYSGSDAYLTSTGSTTETVTCTHLTTTTAASVTSAGCVVGATLSGPVTVRPGGTLALIGATVTGAINATGAKAILICNSTLHGAVTISRPTGQVIIGGPACATNVLYARLTVSGATAPVAVALNIVVGQATLSGNLAGVIVTNNVFYAALSVTGNRGLVYVTANSVTGTTTVSTNTSPPALVVAGNTVGGSLACSANKPAPIDGSQPNNVHGKATGQCAGLA